MTMLDLLLGLIVGGSVIGGFMTGFTRTAFGILATIAGVILGFWFYDVPAKLYTSLLGSQQGANLFGFFTVFLVVLALGTLAGRVASKAFKLVGLGFVDRLGGAAFGLVRGVFVAAAAVTVLLAATPRPVPSWMRGSVLLPYALGASDLASAIAPQAVKDEVGKSIHEIRTAWNEEVEKAEKSAKKALTDSVTGKSSDEPAVDVVEKKASKTKTTETAHLEPSAPPKLPAKSAKSGAKKAATASKTSKKPKAPAKAADAKAGDAKSNP